MANRKCEDCGTELTSVDQLGGARYCMDCSNKRKFARNSAPYERPAPAIELTDVIGPRECASCGSEYVQKYALRTSATGRQIMPWCKSCSEKVAIYLIRSWSD